MTKTVSIYDAARIAILYHEVMTMVSTGSGSQINAMRTPRSSLVEYVALSEKTGLKMFNEHFLVSAIETVEKIETRSAEILKGMK